MTEPLRVLQVVTKMDRGGLETFVMNMYRHIDRSRVQFDFLCHRDGHFAYDSEIEELGGQIYRVPRCNPLNPFYFSALNRFFVKHPYRVVHSHIDCMSALPLAAARRHGAVMRIAHSHSSRQDHDFKYPLKLACKRLIRGEASNLFACSSAAGRWMFGTDDFTVVRNGIEVDSYAFDEDCRKRTREKLNIAPSSFVVGHVGRFAPAKNHTFILNVFSSLLRMRPDAVLLLVGDGELRSNIEHEAAVLGISKSVQFLGVRKDVPDLMCAMDVFLMPSIYEGLGIVIVEAQACGLSCVISDSIPPDCDLEGSNIVRLSLSASAEKWAEVVANTFEKANRSAGVSIVKKAGFDAREVAPQLESFYLEKSGAVL